ncbi:MAG: discoidin domain-containing protein, partial [Chloroflexi bacterium]|nr:discoidin domain-containing protein [Chloroflexota bacterium]
PAVTPVQKRNPSGEDAAFLSWFLVDAGQPFASPAVFRDTSLGMNLALMENGASVAGVSSNFGGGANDSAFGAANALDGDPATEWSTASDGDSAWIEVELPSVTNVTSVGFWTRTMGDTAQVRSFQVTTDRGETYGPFTVDDATTIYRFEIRFTAKRLRFELLDTSGGNTGALEIEVYGEPVP